MFDTSFIESFDPTWEPISLEEVNIDKASVIEEDLESIFNTNELRSNFATFEEEESYHDKGFNTSSLLSNSSMFQPQTNSIIELGNKVNKIQIKETEKVRKFLTDVLQTPKMINDFSCGVPTYRSTRCTRSLTCGLHTESLKILVPRSRPFQELQQEEVANSKEFLMKRQLLKKYFSSVKNYKSNTTIQPANYIDSRAIHEREQLSSSLCIDTKKVFSGIIPKKHSKFEPSTSKIRRAEYIKTLSHNTNTQFEEVASYLRMKLTKLANSRNLENIIDYNFK